MRSKETGESNGESANIANFLSDFTTTPKSQNKGKKLCQQTGAQMKEYTVRTRASQRLGIAFLLSMILWGCGREQGAAPLTLTAVNPNAGIQGQSVPVTITGTGFATGAAINVAGTGIVVSNVVVASTTSITATLAIDIAAALGARDVTVTSAGRTSGAQTFTVQSDVPTLTSMSPNSANQGAAPTVTLTGTGFVPGATVSLSGAGITVTNVTVVSSTQITATFTIDPTTAGGPQDVTLTSSGIVSNTVPFTVLIPTLTSITPNTGLQGQSVAVTLAGANFGSDSTIGFGGTGVTASNVTVVDSATITATFAVASGAAAGAQNVTVTTSGVTTGPQTFTVTLPPAAISSTNPANLGTAVPTTRHITATFNEAMDPTSITAATFTLSAGGTPVAGIVFYDAINNTAIFEQSAALTAGTVYTATITNGAKDGGGNPLTAGGAPNPWTFTTGIAGDTTKPTLVATNPADGATGVPLNQEITATFSEPMDSAGMDATVFLLSQGGTPVLGTVTYAGTTATFTPSSPLTANTLYTATLPVPPGNEAEDLAENSLVASSTPDTWTFTTGTTSDTSAPTVSLTSPADSATAVPTNAAISATFSEAMNPFTITTGTFVVTDASLAQIKGAVTYDAQSGVATFTPAVNLAASATYTAKIETGALDLGGNALASGGLVPNPWTFTTGTTAAAVGPALGQAATFGAFGGGAGVTNQGINTVINGDLGTTGASTVVTGFHDGGSGCIYTETGSDVGNVNGLIYTAPPPPTVGCPGEGTAATFNIATLAAADAQTAFDDLSPASRPGGTDPGAGQLGGLTLTPGIYQAAGGSFLVTGTDLTLDGQGDSNALWVFQTASTLTVGGAGAPRSIILINGAQAKNVYWHVGSAATINAAGGGTMVGTILASAGVSFSTPGNAAISTLNGRALGLNASVTMVNTVINVPAP
jgi:hypothetical protein